MSSTKQMGLSAFDAPHPPENPLSERIADLLKTTGGKWQGSARDLSMALNFSLNSPRALAVKLKKSTDELKRAGVHVTYKQLHGTHLIVLSLAHRAATALTKPFEIEQSSGCSKIIAEAEPVEFPFSWPFATITELTPEEAGEKNAWHTNGRVRTRRPCSLCGSRGVIEFCKTSPGCARVYLCQPCAEDYVRKVRRLMPQIKGVMNGGGKNS